MDQPFRSEIFRKICFTPWLEPSLVWEEKIFYGEKLRVSCFKMILRRHFEFSNVRITYMYFVFSLVMVDTLTLWLWSRAVSVAQIHPSVSYLFFLAYFPIKIFATEKYFVRKSLLSWWRRRRVVKKLLPGLDLSNQDN